MQYRKVERNKNKLSELGKCKAIVLCTRAVVNMKVASKESVRKSMTSIECKNILALRHEVYINVVHIQWMHAMHFRIFLH